MPLLSVFSIVHPAHFLVLESIFGRRQVDEAVLTIVLRELAEGAIWHAVNLQRLRRALVDVSEQDRALEVCDLLRREADHAKIFSAWEYKHTLRRDSRLDDGGHVCHSVPPVETVLLEQVDVISGEHQSATLFNVKARKFHHFAMEQDWFALIRKLFLHFGRDH